MSVLQTQPVLACTRCGASVVVTHLSTVGEDPDSTRLFELLDGMRRTALCEFCLAQRQYYTEQGRCEDWLAGRA